MGGTGRPGGRRRGRGPAPAALGKALALALALAGGAGALDNGLGGTPPMGWNSWGLQHNISEAILRAQADALVSTGLRDLGYRYLNLDGGWQARERGPGGALEGNATLFPSGMGALGDYAHARGLLYGIYSSAGFTACNGFPGSFGFEAQDAAQFAAWGVDYLKYDNCADGSVDPRVRYARMGAALNATGRPVFYSICEWGIAQPWEWAAPIANAWRTTPDIVPSFLHGYGSCHSIANIILQNEATWAAAGPRTGWNDPDLLQVGLPGVSDAEGRTQFGLWAAMKAPLLINADLTRASAATLATLSNAEVIGVNQDPLGVQARRVRQEVDVRVGAADVWAGPLSGGDIVVVLFNGGEPGTKPRDITLRWEDVGLRLSDRARVRDLWARRDEGEFAGRFVGRAIGPHESVMLRLTPIGGAASTKDWADREARMAVDVLDVE